MIIGAIGGFIVGVLATLFSGLMYQFYRLYNDRNNKKHNPSSGN